MTRAHAWVALTCVVAATVLLASTAQPSPAVALGGVLLGSVAFCAYCMTAAIASCAFEVLSPVPRRPLLKRTWLLGNTTEGACARIVMLTCAAFVILQWRSSSPALSAGGLASFALAALFAPAMKKLVEDVLIFDPSRIAGFVSGLPPAARPAAALALQAEIDEMERSYASTAMKVTTWLLGAVVVVHKVVDGLLGAQPTH